MLSTDRHNVRQGSSPRTHSMLSIASMAALGVGCSAPGAAGDDAEPVTFTDRVHMMPLRNRDAGGRTPAGALLHQGGSVIPNVNVTQVLYGSGTWLPELTATGGVTMERAYTQLVTSGVLDWLSEYDTASPAQMIGRGSFSGPFWISPTASRNGAMISDASIQSELVSQFRIGKLPLPDDNTLYMVSFPAGKSLVAPDGSVSCVPDGFCAYHGTFKLGSQNVYYAALPALTGRCATSCGAGSPFHNQQAVASRVLVGAITNAEVGLGSVIGPPLAWYDPNFGEISDICNGQQDTYTGQDGNTYTLHLAFSNTANGCILSKRGVLTADILWRNADTGEVMQWLMANARVAGPAVDLPTEPRQWQIQGTGDFNGDGTTDILWRNTDTGGVKQWLMANRRLASSDIPLPTAPAQWQIQGTGDFNGDGTTDILWRNTDTGGVKEWLMARGQLLGPEIHLYTEPGEWQIQGTGDFNGDRTTDILWRNTSTGQVTEWIMANGQVVGSEIRLSEEPAEWRVEATGDFNGDATTDILWRNTSTGGVKAWLIQNGQRLGAEIELFAQAGEWQIQGTGDFDGDRTTDILWRNTSTGEVTEWIMVNGQISQTEVHLASKPAEWRIQGIGNLDGH